MAGLLNTGRQEPGNQLPRLAAAYRELPIATFAERTATYKVIQPARMSCFLGSNTIRWPLHCASVVMMQAIEWP